MLSSMIEAITGKGLPFHLLSHTNVNFFLFVHNRASGDGHVDDVYLHPTSMCGKVKNRYGVEISNILIFNIIII